MTTSISSQGTPKSQCASITSNALFIIVAESMVILAPIFQVGCLRACSGVTSGRRSSGALRNAPPDAVMMRRETGLSSPRRHCHMALGSLSSGNRDASFWRAARVSSSPAITTVSLFANAMRLPAAMAANVAGMATSPVVAATTMSTSSAATIRSIGHSTLPHSAMNAFSAALPSQYANAGRNSRIWRSKRRWLRPAASATTLKSRGNARAMSKVCVPIEPVEPRTASPRPLIVFPISRNNTPPAKRTQLNQCGRVCRRVRV